MAKESKKRKASSLPRSNEDAGIDGNSGMVDLKVDELDQSEYAKPTDSNDTTIAMAKSNTDNQSDRTKKKKKKNKNKRKADEAAASPQHYNSSSSQNSPIYARPSEKHATAARDTENSCKSGNAGNGNEAGLQEAGANPTVSSPTTATTATAVAAAATHTPSLAPQRGEILSTSSTGTLPGKDTTTTTTTATTTTNTSSSCTLNHEGQQQQQRQSGVSSSTPSSPPQERRRLGKTHARARKQTAPFPDDSGTFESGSGNARTGPLVPGGPGQGRRRKHTLSIAIPGSVVDNAQSQELKSYLVGAIARAAAIFEVDEIVVYDDLSVSRKGQGTVREASSVGGVGGAGSGISGGGGVGGGMGGGVGWSTGGGDRKNPNVFMARLLQFAETPQYLRKQLFPMHPTLKWTGVLNPLDAPHHMRSDDNCPFREGVVVDKLVKKGAGSLVHVGKRKEARIDRPLATGVRVTVKLDQKAANRKNYCGRAVASSAPREELGLYWGYQTRLASGMADVLAGGPFKGGYDLTLGTSERGSVTVDDPAFALPEYRHVLVVFGGVQGIEATVDADETLQLPGSDSSALFDMWVNTCPGQGSRTIRTEEAVLITLARLRQHVLENGVLKQAPTAVAAAAATAAATDC